MSKLSETCKTLEEAKEKWPEIDFGKSKAKKDEKYNHLTIKYRTGDIGKPVEVVCQCDCAEHNYIKVLFQNIFTGKTTSCGCLAKQAAQKMGQERALKYNLVGQKFGKLTVLKRTNKRRGSSVIYQCKCDCGKLCEIASEDLRDIKSCGCLKLSKGEFIIEQILLEHNINYESQKTFNNCRFLDTNYLAYFDFYVENKYIIEFDGEQHFKSGSELGWNTQEKFIKTQEHDNFKNQWCKEHNIPIIRIPYTHLRKICLEDLLLETSQFIIN